MTALTAPTREAHARQVEFNLTKTRFEDVVAVIAEFDAAKADYDAVRAEVAAIATEYPGFTSPVAAVPAHLVALVEALTDERTATTYDWLEAAGGESRDKYPLAKWRKQTRQLRATTARIRKALPTPSLAA